MENLETQKKDAEIVFTINTGMIAMTSIIITVVGMLWNVFYGYGRLSGRIDAMQDDVKEIKQVDIKEIKEIIVKMNESMEKRFDHLETEFHKMDIRVTTLEQRKT